MTYAVLPTSKPAVMMLKTVAVTVVAVSSGLEAGSALAGIVGGFVALLTIGLLIRQNNRANRREHDDELSKARAAGRSDRDDEIRELTNRVNDLATRLDGKDRDIEFYRNQYANLLQQRAGANVVQLPPLNPPPGHPRPGASGG